MDRKTGKERDKKPAKAGKKKATFNRYRDDARPSEFEGRKSSGRPERPARGRSQEEGSSERRKAEPKGPPSRRSFDRDQAPDSRKSESRNDDRREEKKFSGRGPKSDVKKSFEGKERSSGYKKNAEKPFGKRTGAKDAPASRPSKKEVNPYDLDESDFSYGEREEKSERRSFTKTFKKPSKRSQSGNAAASEGSNDGTIRLNKYIANAGICSRREADELIESGVVQVNGKTITEMGFKVKPTDVVRYGGQTLRREKMVYLILNKPKDYITTVDDPEKRRTVLELVRDACRERIYPVGRLDRATTGLLLFTNDGELTKKLTHPRYGVRKIYHVELDKPLKHSDLDKISAGISLEDGDIRVDDISFVGDGTDKRQVGVELHSGKNRIVRRIFESLGYNIRKLDRVMFGPLTKKDLSRGRWRYLTDAEVGMLKMVSAE